MRIVYGTIVAVKRGEELLMLKRANGEIDAGLWEFPTGTFENHDLTIHATAERELKEETGLEAIDMRYLGDIKRKDGNSMYIGYAYVVTRFGGSIALSKEHEEYRWLKRCELANYEIDKNTLVFLQLYKDF